MQFRVRSGACFAVATEAHQSFILPSARIWWDVIQRQASLPRGIFVGCLDFEQAIANRASVEILVVRI